MGIFPKDRNLARPPDAVELEVRASDFGLRPDEVAIRLDAFLHRFLHWRSRTSLQRLIRDGFVDVALPAPERPDGPLVLRPEHRHGRLLVHGARVRVRIPPALRLPDEIPPAQADDELAVLYEDDEVIAVDKPPGLAVHPSGRHLSGTLIQRIHARYESPHGELRLPIRLCHRLDRETSGIVLVAKGDAPHRHIMRQFERRKVKKEYLALVHGAPDDKEGEVDLPLGPARTGTVHLKIAVREDGQPARTRWRLERRIPPFSLVSCRPVTGRQHQIRVHLAAIGLPLVGDKLYGVEEDVFLRASANQLTGKDHARLLLPRHALHNHFLAWHSPRTCDERSVRSPLAKDIARFLERVDS